MIIDDKGRLMGRINIIDLLIILILLAAFTGIAYKYMSARARVDLTNKDDVLIELYNNEIPDYTARMVKTGYTVNDRNRGKVLGTIEEVKIDKSESVAQNDKGELVLSSRPGFSSIHLTVKGKALFSGDKGIRIDSQEYYIGDSVERLTAGNVALFYMKIYDIRKLR